MSSKNIIIISILSIFTLIGVFAMQAFWINNAIKANKIHAMEHIHFALTNHQNEICRSLQSDSSAIIIENLIHEELHKIDQEKKLKVNIYAKNGEITKNSTDINHIIHELQCDGNQIIIEIDCSSNFLLWSNNLTFWTLASILLMLTMAYTVMISLINQHKNKKLEDIKKDFVSNMTHELKTPISTISVASQMLLKAEENKLSNDKILKYSKIIHDENYRLQKLVDKVLILSIFDRNNKMYNFEKLNLVEIIEETLTATRVLIKNKAGKLESKHHHARLFIEGDKTHLKNVIINLLENAIKYSEKNLTIEIETTVENNRAIIKIKDQGIGIPDKEKLAVFNKFHRIANSNKNIIGFGLGLSYVKKTIEIHGGEIYIVDNIPKGSIFVIALPMSQS